MTIAPVKIYFDGGSRGNPGPASGAAYADFEGGRERSCFLESATNNEAEYRGLLMGIELAKELKLSDVIFLGDSKLVVMQVSGQWQAKHPMMNELKNQVIRELVGIPHWQIDWVRREFNAEADRVANQTMDKFQGLASLPKIAISPKIALDNLSASAAPSSLDGTLPAAPVRADIHKLNTLGPKAAFSDFRSLKVGGMDAFSRANAANLATILPNFTELNESIMLGLNTDRHTQSLSDAEKARLLINALRWSARGLAGDLSLRKVLVDLELANNIRGKKS